MTVTVKLHEPLPVAEVAVTVVVPTGKKECDACDVVIAPQLPKPSTEKSTILPETAP